MGCGCGKKRSITVNNAIKSYNNQQVCPNCKKPMIFKQVFVPKLRGYIKSWECATCKFRKQSR